MKDKNLIKSRD